MTDPFRAPSTARGEHPWRTNLPWPALLSIFLTVIAIEAVGVFILSRFGNKIPTLMQEAIIQSLGLATTLLLFALMPPAGSLPGKLGIRPPVLSDIGIALAGLATIYLWQIVSTSPWEKILRWLKLSWQQRQALLAECSGASPARFLALLVLAGFFIPVVEEIIFRRVLFGLFRPLGKLPAMLAASLIFSAAHGFLYGFPALFGLGMILQWEYLRTENLLTPMLTHIIYNTIALTLVFLLGL